MHFTIEQLIHNNSDILEWYKRAKEIWNEIFKKFDPAKSENIDLLAKELFNKQLQFEHECGGRWIGQEIMVISGIAQFYSTDTGFDVRYDQEYDYRLEKARNLYQAFQLSYCSIEVKGHARNIAESYDLEEDES